MIHALAVCATQDSCRADRRGRALPALGLGLVLLVGAGPAVAQQRPDSAATVLKTLSIEQLMDLEVTSVSKRSERLAQAASAIQVITGEEIRRSGATNLPEALRLAANLQVAQVNASQWAVSARGFNNVLANKLLVMVDGRTVYTPLYAGVFWDVQNPPLEIIDRIEVISGPGGALWGANAVNGVINVITKKAGETAGWSVQGTAGTKLRSAGELRYGAPLGPSADARVYLRGFDRGSTEFTASDADANDDWHLWQGGGRIDWRLGEGNVITFTGDGYNGHPDPDGGAPVTARGGNIVARWARTLAPGSDLRLQVYYDRRYRDFGNGFTEDLATYDVDFQHRFALGERHAATWGVGTRLMDHATENLELFRFDPSPRLLHLYSAFVQDEIALAPDRLRLTLGSKFERNDYTGFEIQPSLRLAWNVSDQSTLWGAVSRAVRTPARIDRDFSLLGDSVTPIIVPGGLRSETVIAYELGWRVEPTARLALAFSTFHNVYDHIRSAEPDTSPSTLPIRFKNGVRGHSEGIEVAATYHVTDRWRLKGGYTYFQKSLSLRPGSHDLNQATAESDDPPHHAVLQSSLDLPGRIEWDLVARYVDDLPKPAVPSFVGLDLRLGWKATSRLGLAIVGQNLLDDRHQEFIASAPTARSIARGMYATVTWR